jgi:anaerobic magnesium-protoporphyrin IX monomethyl ester cyclase
VSRVLVGQSYFLRFDPKLWEQHRPYPPLGSLYAAAVLRDQGHDVAFFDAMLADGVADFVRSLDTVRPDVAVLFEDNFNYLSKMCLLRMRQAAVDMTAAARRRGCRVVIAGSDATDHPETYLQAGADHVILGEGEDTLAELLAVLDRDGDPLTVAGLAVLDGDRVVRTPPRPVIRDPDRLPWPARDLVDLDRYRAIWRDRHGRFSLNMATTRGCPFHCNWCAKPIWGQRSSVRSADAVAAELAWLVDHHAPDHIWFTDDIFGLRPGWVHAFADAVERHGHRVPFTSLNRADLLLRDGEVGALARAGAEQVWIGAESGSQRILDAMEKGTTVEQIRQATRRLHEAGIEVGWFLQFGYPGEGRDDIEATLQLVRDERPDDIGISVSYPLPGTPFHDRVRDQLGARANWTDSDDLAMLYDGPFGTSFYRQLHAVVHGEFRARRHLEALRAGWRDRRLRPAHLRHAAAWLRHRAARPLRRRRLDRLATATSGPAPLPVALDRDAAGTPTPQDVP